MAALRNSDFGLGFSRVIAAIVEITVLLLMLRNKHGSRT